MKLTLDTDRRRLVCEHGEQSRELDLYSREAFEIVSYEWLRIGWSQKYSYTFSWLGRPIIQLPEDMVRVQEVVYRLRPDVIVETGIAHGGSLIFYASLCALMGHGRVIGIEIELRPENRRAIEAHPLSSYIEIIEGSSTDEAVVRRVRAAVAPGQTVLVILDSNHSRQHVLAELEAYHDLVSVSSFIVATDGIMRDLADVPRGETSWRRDNPRAAVEEFLRRHPGFLFEQPSWAFNESALKENVTHWPGAWLKRIR
jgi:cephalosporin hydroxylase